ncbi:MAG: ATP-binding protein [Okeania sp. SIO3I5]|uniref:ATP-binding protein n=1 Tax=Okeania sp. SIO3I5 TaxID=2607805 RepID=UPI0013B834CA|nr:ATP-binding protein [Okeania sp. SIO3I5]NEQ40138.1 ATP-binding protein [Okeania sp. SIO3I5]
MNTSQKLLIQGIPDTVPEPLAAVYRSRLLTAVNKLLDETGIENIQVIIGTPLDSSSSTFEKNNSQNGQNSTDKKSDRDLSPEERAKRYEAQEPLFTFEQLVIPEKVTEDLLLAVDLIELEAKVFDKWGLRKIEPFPRTALNFHGKPGTGKTLAAHAIASKINRPILVASYAQIESMYHGEGPKNVEAIFLAAEQQNALLFIDEADSLLSKRLTNVTQGSEQAINSMRSQLLICLERFRGVVMFSTNLVENYDKAFETRVRNINFPMPDETCRLEIWKRHLVEELPTPDVSLEKLAQVEDVCGRDIKNAVIDAAMRAARQGKEEVALSQLLDSINSIKKARVNVTQELRPLTPEEKEEAEKKIKEALAKKKQEATS